MKPKSLQKLPWRLPELIDSSRNNQSDGRRLRTWTLKLKQSRMQTISWLTIWCEGIEKDNHSIQGICVVSSIFTSQDKYVFSWIYVSVRASAKTMNYEFWCLIRYRRKCDKQWDFFGEEKVSFSELFCLCDSGLWTRWSTSTLLLRSSGFKSFWPIHRPDLSLTPSQPWPLNVNHIIHNFNGTRNPLHPTITL